MITQETSIIQGLGGQRWAAVGVCVCVRVCVCVSVCLCVCLCVCVGGWGRWGCVGVGGGVCARAGGCVCVYVCVYVCVCVCVCGGLLVQPIPGLNPKPNSPSRRRGAAPSFPPGGAHRLHRGLFRESGALWGSGSRAWPLK